MRHKKLLIKLFDVFLKEPFTGVEIGVDKGDTTVFLLKNCPRLEHLYGIDPYVDRDPRVKTITKDTAPYNNFTLIRKKSEDSVEDIPDELGFIFVDGDHSYETVMSDLRNYVPKIRSGGLLIGHDWTNIRNSGSGTRYEGVVRAGEQYLVANQDLFQPPFSNEELISLGLTEFQQAGYSKELERNLIHKKVPSFYPVWWLVKK